MGGRDMNLSFNQKQALLIGFKLFLGSMAAVLICEQLKIRTPYAAGSIALITLLSSKWDTIRLTLYRLLTYFVTVFVSWLVYTLCRQPVISFGISMAFLYWFCKAFDLMSTLAVNGVICSHFMTYTDFGSQMIIHEFLIVLIGVLCALIINQLYTKRAVQQQLGTYIKESEQELVELLYQVAEHLSGGSDRKVSLEKYERTLRQAYELAKDFEENTFSRHTNYYANYFRMRSMQCHMLKNVVWELSHMPMQPAQTKVVVHYIRYLARYVTETNAPYKQQEELRNLLKTMQEEPLPKTRKEFESRAYLFHILMDLDEFVQCKQTYMNKLSEKQKERFWGLKSKKDAKS